MGEREGSESWEKSVWVWVWVVVVVVVLLLGGGEGGSETGDMLPESRRWREEVMAVRWPRSEDEVNDRPVGGEFCGELESADSRRAISLG
jgi:hypothetical protein